MFELLTNDREFADHNKALLQQWLSVWVPRAHRRGPHPAAASGRSPTPSRRGSRTAWTRQKSRFSGILSDLSLETPKELAQ